VLLGSRQYVTNKLEAFWDSWSYDGFTMLIDADAPAQTVLAPDKKGLMFGKLGGQLVRKYDADGLTTRTALRTDGDGHSRYAAAVNIHFFAAGNLACRNRFIQSKFVGIRGLDEENAGYSTVGGLSA
jgi:hypothetical protein